MNIELYIGDRLCDIGNPEDLGIYLKRVFIKPSELSVKDAQKSYEISLPATAANNEIFNYTNIEEVQGKFKVYDKARLYIDGILILDGKFRMSQITRDAYIGNLGVPAPKTVKDIFGETMMNQAGKWLIPFEGVQDITTYNTGGHEKDKYGEISPCIFPLVLYKLLQKEKGSTSNKDVLDDSVNFRLLDFPPSVNCVHLLRQLFDSARYNLTGTALTDEPIKNLYVSYKNSNDYEMPWNANNIIVEGDWTNYDGKNFEANIVIDKRDNDKHVYPVNLFNSSISTPNVFSNNKIDIEDMDKKKTLIIPRSGLYKIKLTGRLELSKDKDKTYYYNNGADSHRVAEPQNRIYPNDGPISIPVLYNLENRRFELKLLRNYTDLNDIKFDNTFYKDNLRQDMGTLNPMFPSNGQVNFIDPKQNNKMLCGLSWGCHDAIPEFKNPLNIKNANPMAISGGISWDEEINDKYFAATSSEGYKIKTGSGVIDANWFKVELNSPANKADHTSDYMSGEGVIHQIVWFEKGDTLTLTTVSDQVVAKGDNMNKGCWMRHNIHYSLSVTPFRYNKEWLTVNKDGASDPDKPMNWNDEPTFNWKEIDLVKFLPPDIKINDWIDNFCKTFNLSLEHKGSENFEMNLRKKTNGSNSVSSIDLDSKANIKQCANESLKLPAVYRLSFTADSSEKGYYDTMVTETDEQGVEKKIVNSGDKGEGWYNTGSMEESEINMTSSFSHNWFKTLLDKDGNKIIDIPVITDHEIWVNDHDYEEMHSKEFYDKAQRFWYPSGLTNLKINSIDDISVAKVSNEYKGQKNLILNYKDNPNTIAKNYFMLLANNNNSYTIVECYLTPEEYSNLDKAFVKFNGDLYYTAEVDGYDPLCKKKCRLKLIREII